MAKRTVHVFVPKIDAQTTQTEMSFEVECSNQKRDLISISKWFLSREDWPLFTAPEISNLIQIPVLFNNKMSTMLYMGDGVGIRNIFAQSIISTTIQLKGGAQESAEIFGPVVIFEGTLLG